MRPAGPMTSLTAAGNPGDLRSRENCRQNFRHPEVEWQKLWQGCRGAPSARKKKKNGEPKNCSITHCRRSRDTKKQFSVRFQPRPRKPKRLDDETRKRSTTNHKQQRRRQKHAEKREGGKKKEKHNKRKIKGILPTRRAGPEEVTVALQQSTSARIGVHGRV